METKELKVDGGVIQRGEATGHAHRIATPETAEVWEGPNGKMIKPVGNSGDLIVISHEEHNPIKLAGGKTYACGIVVERDHVAEATRNVID